MAGYRLNQVETIIEGRRIMNSKVIASAIVAAGVMIAIAIYATRGGSMIPSFLDPHSEVKVVIEGSLYDPSSAQYRNWKESSLGYCVEINAKNKFGAYTGFKKIFAMKLTNDPKKFSIADDDIEVRVLCKE